MILLSQFAKIESLLGELDRLGLTQEEQSRVLELVDEIFQHRLLSEVLNEFESEEKIRFLELLDQGSGEEIVGFIKTRVVNVEDRIKIIVEEIHSHVIEDISSINEDKFSI